MRVVVNEIGVLVYYMVELTGLAWSVCNVAGWLTKDRNELVTGLEARTSQTEAQADMVSSQGSGSQMAFS